MNNKQRHSSTFYLISSLTTDNLSKKLFRCVSKERNTADQELVKYDPHRPPVHWLPIALSKDHLWGNVLWSATHLHKESNTGEGNRNGCCCKWVSLVSCKKNSLTCLSTNSLVSFSTWPSYRLVVMFIRPILDRPKSVSLMWPMDVINKLLGGEKKTKKQIKNTSSE